MGNESANNMQKYENYKDQFKKLKRALENEFFLEAIFVEYAIIEDRTKAILVLAGKYEAYLKKRGRYSETLDSKVKYIQGFAAEKKTLLHRYFGDNTLDRILEWKESRNTLIHALLNQKLTTENLKDVASTGQGLARILCDRVTNYRRYLMRHQGK